MISLIEVVQLLFKLSEEECEKSGEYKVVNNGSMDPEKYFDDFLKELDKAGIDVIIKEVQKQVDEFVKKK